MLTDRTLRLAAPRLTAHEQGGGPYSAARANALPTSEFVFVYALCSMPPAVLCVCLIPTLPYLRFTSFQQDDFQLTINEADERPLITYEATTSRYHLITERSLMSDGGRKLAVRRQFAGRC